MWVTNQVFQLKPILNDIEYNCFWACRVVWPQKAISWIEALSEEQVLSKLQGVMEGLNYSWYTINDLLQNRLDQGQLEFTVVDGHVLFECNNLRDEKRVWERKGRLSHNCPEFNRDRLIKLMILPSQGGLGLESKLSTASGCHA